MVKLATSKDSGVLIGSILTSINGESVVLQSYLTTITKLKNWKPPLTLGFRRTPLKCGYLMKHSKSKKSTETELKDIPGAASSKVWKKRFFSLENGRLQYRDSDSPGDVVKGISNKFEILKTQFILYSLSICDSLLGTSLC